MAPFPRGDQPARGRIDGWPSFLSHEYGPRQSTARGGDAGDVYITGNMAVDDLLFMRREVLAHPGPFPPEVRERLAYGDRMVLVTGHRRENFGQGFRQICQALRRLATLQVVFLYPHMNPRVLGPAKELLGGGAPESS